MTSLGRQQLKAELQRISQALSASSKQLRSNNSAKVKHEALKDSITTHRIMYQTLIRTPASSLPLYLNYKIPAKLWDLAVCQLQCLHNSEPEFQTLAATGATNSLASMAYLQTTMPQNHTNAALVQMLPFNGDGSSGSHRQRLEVLVICSSKEDIRMCTYTPVLLGPLLFDTCS